MGFVSYGIHTRLHYEIQRTGGLDKEIRRAWLEAEYGLDKESLDLVLMYNVEDRLKDSTLEELKQLIINQKSNEKSKSAYAMRSLTGMLTSLCYDSNMLFR